MIKSVISIGNYHIGFLPVWTLAFHLAGGNVIRKRVNCFKYSTNAFTYKVAPGEIANFELRNFDQNLIAINIEKRRWRFGIARKQDFKADPLPR